MYDYTIFQPESVYDRGSYQKSPSIYEVFRHIRDELEKYPNIMEKGWLEFRMIPMNIPHYAYMIIEGRKEFTICKTLTGYS